MRFRKLRIAWSVFWGLVAALVVALWVRSFISLDTVWWPLSKPTARSQTRFANSFDGRVYWSKGSNLDASTPAYGGYSVDVKGSGKTKAKLVRQNIGIGAKSVPYWPFAATVAALSTLPWLALLPRRFTLRTLLIATTLVAVVLGLIVAVLRWPAS